MEFGFIFFIDFMIALISDLECSTYEEHNIAKLSHDFAYWLVTGFFAWICYAVYYWGFLKGYVYRRKWLGVIVCSFAFVILEHLENIRIHTELDLSKSNVSPHFLCNMLNGNDVLILF